MRLRAQPRVVSEPTRVFPQPRPASANQKTQSDRWTAAPDVPGSNWFGRAFQRHEYSISRACSLVSDRRICARSDGDSDAINSSRERFDAGVMSLNWTAIYAGMLNGFTVRVDLICERLVTVRAYRRLRFLSGLGNPRQSRNGIAAKLFEPRVHISGELTGFSLLSTGVGVALHSFHERHLIRILMQTGHPCCSSALRGLEVRVPVFLPQPPLAIDLKLCTPGCRVNSTDDLLRVLFDELTVAKPAFDGPDAASHRRRS